MDKKTIWTFAGVGVAVILLAVVLFLKQSASQIDWAVLDSQITYYHGVDCPHCLKVSQFIEENKIAEKVAFTKKEVSLDFSNGQEFLQVVKKCGLQPSEAGVPLVYAEGKCFMGEPDVTNFFKEKAGIAL
jgi:glutaredoxin